MASPSLAVRITRSPERQRLLAYSQRLRDEIRRAMNDDVKPVVVETMNDVVDNWKHKPKFVASLFFDDNTISLYVEPIGPEAKYWEWTSRGTRPHPIVARNKPLLVFRSAYEPKTTVGPPPTWGGPGKSSGNYVRWREVQHPGTDPRNFEEHVKEHVIKEFRSIIENAMRRGLRG